LTIADLDGDGHPDLAVNNSEPSAGSTSVELDTLRNNGDGSFSPWRSYDSPQSIAMAAGPFLSSDSVDLLVGCEIFPNVGGGIFGTPISYPPNGSTCDGSVPNALVVNDYDGDGRMDLAWALNGLTVYLNRGGGSFDKVDLALNEISDVYSQVNPLAGADFDRDGRPDLVGVGPSDVAPPGPSYIRLFYNTGGGTFAETDIISAEQNDRLDTVAADDLNDDGWPDLVLHSYLNASLEVFLNRGDGTFGPPTRYASTAAIVNTIAVGDLNGDGVKDLVLGPTRLPNGGTGLDLVYGRGDGTFSPAVEWPLPGYVPWSIALGDLNGDGHADVAVAVFNESDTGSDIGNAVDVFLSQCR